jgi:NADH:ubiquinone oxidoreductase subunit F (NADH-binding)/NADH:ubiquinone oxidoreductase subunit E
MRTTTAVLIDEESRGTRRILESDRHAMGPSKIRIQHELSKIQDRWGYLPVAELKALAARAESLGQRLPLRRLHEVASYFPHYRLKKPAGLEVKVCREMVCHLNGAPAWRRRLETLAATLGGGRLNVGGVPCLGHCDAAPAVVIGDETFWGLSIEDCEFLIREAIASGLRPHPQRTADRPRPDWQIDPYHDGPIKPYAVVREFLKTTDSPRAHAALHPADGSGIIAALKVSGLRGMGGPGKPAHEKWLDVKTALLDRRSDEKYVVCNADESEPGTFKDRELLVRTPHLIIEGVILAGLVVGACRGFIYIRREYRVQIEAIEREIARAEALKVCGGNVLGTGKSFPLEVYISPGGYICGEQSALVEAMEDRRAEPRNRPPELATNGLWNKPTLVSNVETFAWVPSILLRGGAWYRDQGVNGGRGLRFFSISGDVVNPGVFEVPIGLPLGALIQRAGGVAGGKALKAVATSGPSGGFVPPQVPIPADLRLPKEFPAERMRTGATHRSLLDMELDIDVFKAFDLMLGAGIIVYADGADMADCALNCSEFFRNESCGKCVPCRQGSERLVQLAREIRSGSADPGRLDAIEDRVAELRAALRQTSICGLGMSAAEPLASTYQFFRADLERYQRRIDGTEPPESTP